EVTAPAATGRPVVLFVHGAGTPAEVSFDAPYADYSWMAYLARAGYDVFSLDMTGYGRSTRPAAMQDACNFPKAQQARFVPSVIQAPCQPTAPTAITTMSSDWQDIEATVDMLLRLRGAQSLDIVAWSQGGPRSVGYALRHPEKVRRLVLLAPAYTRDSAGAPPASLPPVDGAMNAQSKTDFTANWDRQVGCPGQYEPAAREAIWADMLGSDPVGAKWGPGVRRAPSVPTWGFNQATVANLKVPVLMVAGEHDKQVAPQRVHDFYQDVGAPQKVVVDLACSSHNAMWERNHQVLFATSLEWLKAGTVNGRSTGTLRLGD
ncbi:MAG: alpha/beta hydrolase, partial [Ramlibacter sp.]